MAKNLRSKIPEADVLNVYDTNIATTTRFLNELKEDGLDARTAQSPREVVEKSVSGTLESHLFARSMMSLIQYYMI
jgi:hypothetical protein